MQLDLKRIARFAPRRPRRSVAVDTTVLLPDDREVAVRLTNVSAGGFSAVSEAHILPGTTLGIGVPSFGIRRAEVRWATEKEFGGRFLSCLPVNVVDKL